MTLTATSSSCGDGLEPLFQPSCVAVQAEPLIDLQQIPVPFDRIEADAGVQFS